MSHREGYQPATGVQLLLALDFDGTIAPIVSHPRDAAIDASMHTMLEELASRPGIAVAVVSGRDVEDLHTRTHGLPIYRAGSHGADCVAPDGRHLWGAEASPLHLTPELFDALSTDGFTIERKKISIAAHFRNLDMTRQRLDTLRKFGEWAVAHELDLVAGRNVLEARVRATSKVSALRLLARHTRAQRVIFAGDDLTDFDALLWAAEHGRAFFVESSEREPPSDDRILRVTGIDELRLLIAEEVRCSSLTTQVMNA